MSLNNRFSAISAIVATNRSVSEAIRKQGEEGSLYKLVALKGGGDLVKSMKEAKQSNNYTLLDDRISEGMTKFLYNKGIGKQVGISVLKKTRKCIKEGVKIEEHFETGEIEKNEVCRDTCWRLDERGTVGETILHLCLLNASTSSLHMELARRLLMKYPNLIKDIYVSDEYYGENVLHMAIVNEDPRMVKFLLDHGADIHGRCCGQFFHPYDQRERRVDKEDSDVFDVPVATNYAGAVYFGEYPLSFAACLGQIDCVRLLLGKKANPDLQDNNGNCVMHMLVIHDRKNVFEMLYKTGLVRLDIMNRQGFTPMTLAAHLAHKGIYDYIMELHMTTVWRFGDYLCTKCPLKNLDTIKPCGEIDETSALNIIINGDKEEHLDMIDNVISNLLKEKWKMFIKVRFYRKLVFFIIYYLCLGAMLGLRPKIDYCALSSAPANITNYADLDEDVCYLRKICRPRDYGRFVIESLVLVIALIDLIKACREAYQRKFLFLKTLWRIPPKFFFLLSCLCVVIIALSRAGCAHETEDVMCILAILTASPYFFFFLGINKIIGPFVVMLHVMIVGDIVRFVLIYIIFIMGFSQAFYIAFSTAECDRSQSHCALLNRAEGITATFSMSVGDFEDIYGLFPLSDYTIVVKILFVIYMVMVTLLLVNLLIAMMGNTYHQLKDSKKVAFRQWARVVLVMEQYLTPYQLALVQLQYCEGDQWEISDWMNTDNVYLQMMSITYYSDTLCLITRWHESKEEREEKVRIQEKIRSKQMASVVTLHKL